MVERLREQRQRLMQKIQDCGPRLWALNHLPDPKICGSDNPLPKILYLHLGYEKKSAEVLENYLNKTNLNKPGSLLSFTQNPLEAVYYDYSNRLKDPDSQESLLIMLFPYEATNVNRWAIDLAAHRNLPLTRVYLTDQAVKKQATLLARYSQLINKAEDKNIQAAQHAYPKVLASGKTGWTSPELPWARQTQENVMKMFNITVEGQKQIFQQLRSTFHGKMGM